MKHKLYHHIVHHAIGKFIGFIAALWASGLVSAFFEKKSSRNLWGVDSEKAVLDSDTYKTIESSLSVMIGFIVLLFVDYLVETKKHISLWNYLVRKMPVVRAEVTKYIMKGKSGINSRLKMK